MLVTCPQETQNIASPAENKKMPPAKVAFNYYGLGYGHY